MKRAWVVLAVVALGAGVSVAPAAAAPVTIVTASLTATPSAGLADGHTVQVHGSGFAPTANTGSTATVALCAGNILDDPTNGLELCGATLTFPVPIDGAGTLSSSLTVFRSQPNYSGTGTVNCLAPAGCAVFAIEVVLAGGFVAGAVVAAAPVSFRPLTIRDCIAGRWRSLTDAHGRPFRSEFACAVFALRHAFTPPTRPLRRAPSTALPVLGRV